MGSGPFLSLVRRGILAPGQDFLPKPFSPAALAERLRRLVAAVPPPASQPRTREPLPESPTGPG